MQGVRTPHARLFARLTAPALALLAAAFALSPGAANAAPGGSITMSPAATTMSVGDTVSVTFDVTGGSNIHRVRIGLQYNASVLQAVDADAATPGTQILPGPFPGTDTEGAVTQNAVTASTINYQYQLAGSSIVSGDGTIATVQFVAIANGNAGLGFTVHQFADTGGASTNVPAVPASILVGGVVVAATPEPSLTDEPSATPEPSFTPAATDIAATSTPRPSTATRTPTRTSTPVVSKTAAGGTATRTSTPTRTPTPNIVLLHNSNAKAAAAANSTAPTPVGAGPEANNLPTSGAHDQRIAWWKWSFFGAALMLAFAGWFFTFAVHYGDREPVLMDRYDVSRRKYGKRR